MIQNKEHITNFIPKNYPGVLFEKLGGDEEKPCKVIEALRGVSDQGFEFEIGNFQTNVVSRLLVLKKYGYVKMPLSQHVPQMALDSIKHRSIRLGSYFQDRQVVGLEGDFSKYFTLYVPQGYERDALYIFTPDLMALLIDETDIFDIEITNGSLLLYGKRFNLKDEQLINRLLLIVDVVGNKLQRRTTQYVAGRDDPVEKKPLKSRMRFAYRLAMGFAIFAIIVLVAATISGFIDDAKQLMGLL